MRYDIQFKPRAARDLRKLDRPIASRIVARIESLRDDLQGDVKRLTSFTPQYRLRVGDYRVLFETESATIVVYRVLHRREAYQ